MLTEFRCIVWSQSFGIVYPWDGLINHVKAQDDHKFCVLLMIALQLHIPLVAIPSPAAKSLSEDCSEFPLYHSPIGDVPQLAHVVGNMWVFRGVTGFELK